MSNNYIIPSLDRSLDLLEYIAASKEPVRFEEMLKQTGISRSTAYRVLITLEHKGYVEKIDINNGLKWRLGNRMIKMGIDYITNLDLRDAARSSMQWLGETTDEMVQLGILFQGRIMYIDQIKRIKPLTVYVESGALLSINLSASGMVLAAQLSEQEIMSILNEHGLIRNTANSITDETEFLALLKLVKQQGYAIDNEMFATGIRCIAAPIFHYSGETAGAIGISGHLSTITDERLTFFIDSVKEAAQQISNRLGFKA